MPLNFLSIKLKNNKPFDNLDLSKLNYRFGFRRIRQFMSSIEIVENAYRAFAAGNIPAVLEVFDRSISWTDMEGFPTGGTYVGAEAILNGVFIRLGMEWNDFQAVPDEFLDAGQTIVALGNYTGTFKTTGKSMRVPFAHVWGLRDDKIVKFVQYIDTLKVSEAL